MSISKDISEKELLDRLKEGSHEAFEMLYHRHSPQLLLKLERKLPDAVDADEIIQELFIKIWDRRQQIDPEKSFGGYLYRIAQRMLRPLLSNSILCITISRLDGGMIGRFGAPSHRHVAPHRVGKRRHATIATFPFGWLHETSVCCRRFAADPPADPGQLRDDDGFRRD